MDFGNLGKKEVFRLLKSSELGLNEKDVENKLKEYGLNELKEKKENKALKILLEQIKNIVIYILFGAVLISLYFKEYLDAGVILAILILNVILGFIQDYKAEKAIESLKKITVTNVKVLRNNKKQVIDSKFLVSGDIIFLESGDKIPADSFLLETNEFKVDESVLTGESVPVKKEVDNKKDRRNLVFSGTNVVYGNCRALVLKTGMSTELGKIADLIQTENQRETPLQKKLGKLGLNLGIITIFISIIILISGLLRQQELSEILLVSVSLAVAAIPEGLPAVVTISLALGVQRMVKNNVLVRKLSSAETLGSVTIIASDKTGTITCNQMTVKKIYGGKNIIDVTGEGYGFAGNFLLNNSKFNPNKISKLIQCASLCNNAQLSDKKHFGDPTEIALLVLGKKAKLNFTDKRIKEIPFSSENKFMGTINQDKNKKILFLKGAPEVILKKSSRILINNKIVKLTDKKKREILNVNENFANNALRVLGFCYNEKLNEKNSIFLGLIGMIDPPRKEVHDSIALCKKAGIRVVMITGDHKLTAQAIARQIGLKDRALTGEELDKLSQEKLKKIAKEIEIYARVNPIHKVKILEALENNNIIAMTGDGVNDAPALKKADIGVSVGDSSDVAKEASNLILLDNSFASIVKAVKEGRGIYNNIKKFVNYLLSSNLGEVFTLFFAMMFGFKDTLGNFIIPLLPLQILWINLVTDGLPALALGVDPINNDIMHKKPRNPKENIISKNMIFNVLFTGLIFALTTLILFKLNLNDPGKAQTIAFSTLVILELFRVNIIRKQYNTKLFANKYLILAVISSILLQLITIYTPLNKIFNTTFLSLTDWIFIILVSLFATIICRIFYLISIKITKQVD